MKSIIIDLQSKSVADAYAILVHLEIVFEAPALEADVLVFCGNLYGLTEGFFKGFNGVIEVVLHLYYIPLCYLHFKEILGA